MVAHILHDDVVAAVKKAVHQRYLSVAVIGYMESEGTDGMQFRRVGIPIWTISDIFMNPDEKFADGFNERAHRRRLWHVRSLEYSS